jgi:Na+-driven multidrug efflux pump
MVSEDPLVIEAATQYLFVAPLAIGFMGVTMNCLSSFNALGKPTPPMVISFLQMCVFAIPLALLGDYLFGYRGVFMAGVLSNLLTALMAYFWLRKYFSSRAW